MADITVSYQCYTHILHLSQMYTAQTYGRLLPFSVLCSCHSQQVDWLCPHLITVAKVQAALRWGEVADASDTPKIQSGVSSRDDRKGKNKREAEQGRKGIFSHQRLEHSVSSNAEKKGLATRVPHLSEAISLNEIRCQGL